MIDKSCAKNHFHDNVELIIKLPVMEAFLDYKHIKTIAQRILKKYESQNITDKYEIETTEEFITVLSDDFKGAFGRPVEITFWETEKYGMEIASC